MMTTVRTRILAAALAIASVLSTDAVVAQDFGGLVTDVSVTESEVHFSIKPGYESVNLVVAGPSGFLVERAFAMDEEPSFSIPSANYALVDGSYTFELRGTITLPAEVRSELMSARETGDRMLIAAILSDAGLDPSSAVTSGRIGIFDGEFVLPEAEPTTTSPASRSGADSGETTGRGFRDAALNGTASVGSVASDGPWLDALISSTNPDGSVNNYRGYVLPPQMGRGSDRQYLRAYFRLVDSGEAGPWIRGYFESEEGSFRFVDQSSFDAAGLRSAISAPFDFETASSEPLPPLAVRDQIIQDDLVVVGSACIGLDCVNGESFGFDTIRVKENNLRIRFQDTSSSSSFPTGDWQLTANDSANGGANKFSIDDIDSGRTPFTVLQGAPSHSLFVNSSGNIGLGTSTPVVEIHSKDGNTPTLRLEQDGTSGFAAQTWDIAGNETNFFVRDATNGSTLPFRIITGASNNSLYIAADGDIGFETSTPDGQFDVAHSANANNHAFLIDPNSNVGVNIDNGQVPAGLFDVQTTGGVSRLTVTADGAVVAGGDLTLAAGTITSDTGTISFGNENVTTTGLITGTTVSGIASGVGLHADRTGSTSAASVKASNDGATAYFGVEGATAGGFFPGASSFASVIYSTSDLQYVRGQVLQLSISSSIADFQDNAITTTGNVTASGYATASSRRWKTDIETIDNALSTVQDMRGVSYSWKADGKADIGLIAEEVGAVIPEIVTYEGNGVDARSVDYARIVAVLIEAIKEQQEMIEQQGGEITALTERTGALQARVSGISQMLTRSEPDR